MTDVIEDSSSVIRAQEKRAHLSVTEGEKPSLEDTTEFDLKS